jgi:Protein of unknown function (DUF3606)
MMRTHDGRINHLQCRVGQAAAGERLQHHIPDATVSPAAELPKNRIPVAELLRQIAPRRAGPHQPKRRVHHTAMVARRTASATDQKRFEIRPLIIGQQSANQGCPPQRAALNQFSIPASIDLSTRPSRRRKMMAKKTSRGRKQDRARVAGGQEYEVRYEAKKTGKPKSAVKAAAKKAGPSRKKVERALGR